MRHVAIALVLLAGCDGCRKSEPPAANDADAAAPSPGAASAPRVVAEPLPRCRPDPRDLVVPGEEVAVGDAVIAPDGLLVGVVRRDGGKRLAGVLRASLDLSSSKVTDLGSALGDDPPPVPYLHGGEVTVAIYTRKKDGADAGIATPGATRELRLLRLDGTAVGSVVQQADESTAFDVAWPAEGAPLVAWDEDAPIAIGQFLADRGTVKVQVLGSADKPHAIPPYATDAEQPKLLARGGASGGYWLAWIARRGEAEPDSGTYAPEGPAEDRDHRWIELAMLDPKGELASPIRRVSPDRGRVVSFELAPGVGAKAGVDLAVLVQDEVALGEGGGARLVRYAVTPDRVDGADLVDGGVGRALAELVTTSPDAGAPRWLSWTDGAERAHLVPVGPSLLAQGAGTVERKLDRSRVVAATPDAVYAVTSENAEGGGHVVLRRLTCH
jgi:hypothetical protein